MISTFDRSYADDILPEKLNNYIKEFENDIKISEANIREKAMLKSSIAAKWARYYYEEEKFKNKIENSITDLKNQIAEKLFEKKKASIKEFSAAETMLKIEAEKVFKQTSQYQAIKQQLDVQEDVLRFITEAKQMISAFGFDIKNAIDILKLENI